MLARTSSDAATQTPWKIVVLAEERPDESVPVEALSQCSLSDAERGADAPYFQQSLLEILLDYDGIGGRNVLRCATVCR